ncbi:MAG TPA: NAD-dependent epimerase/dehydratase family protein [Gillisia sp.]|nr:NAD-dependent epimerase/dehydratase family protein [Gillisia sp.]
MQTILGAGGVIATELAKALTFYTKEIRLVSRTPEPVNETDEVLIADLTDYDQTLKAVTGSEVAYLTVGLPYDTKVWQKKWPVIMDNVIKACLKARCKLVFFDNIYMYDGSNLNPITEETPINPPSEKGKVRARLVEMLWGAVKSKDLQALIARSADFYGPGIQGSGLLNETVIKPLSKGKKANWLMDYNYKHSFTYTVDAGKATALLGNTPDAFGQTWHLPTAKDPWTGKQWIEEIAKEMQVVPKFRRVGKSFVRFLGIFIPEMKESVEMLYQYDRDYVFNSDKFENKFSQRPTDYKTGVREVIAADYHKQRPAVSTSPK